ncbi:monooxygenase [Chryseobacterium sp. M5A1_1a]
MVLLQINFDFPIELMVDNLVVNAIKLAESINDETGFISKIWIENKRNGRSGGIYLFDNMQNAEKYVKKHIERVTQIGATNINCQYFDVNEPLSKINRSLR